MLRNLSFLPALAILLAACGEGDRSKAEAGASWLAEKRLFRPFGQIGEITKISVESAEEIRMHVTIPDDRHVEAIDAQSLMIQSMIAKYACPSKGSDLWPILGDTVKLRVDLRTGDKLFASGICKGP